MSDSGDEFTAYCTAYFTRLCRGYAGSLDDTLVRAWLPGVKNAWDHGGNWLAPARVFPALAAWLADPKRDAVVTTRGQSFDLEELALAVVERAFDPQAPGHWAGAELPPFSQETVETSYIAYGLWLLRDRLPALSASTLRNVQDWLAHFTSAPVPNFNKALFFVVTHAARKALGWDYSQDTIDEGWRIVEGLHRGDGWFTDGRERAFDDYNWWVFGTHALMWAQLDGDAAPALRERVYEQSQRRLDAFPYFFGADGSYTEYGRSLSYKFGRLGFPLLAHKLGVWPHGPGLLKRLVRRHLGFYDNVGAIDRRTDTVRQELSDFGHPDVRELYMDTGSPYWCMQAFTSLWQLGVDDALWNAAEDPLPVERGDFTKVIEPAGWILAGSQRSGQVQRHNVGSSGEVAKYCKLTYSSRFPVNVGTVEGDVGPDAALCITDGDHWAHPAGPTDSTVGETHLRARYTLRVGATAIECDTVIVPDGEGSLRVHRLRVPADAPRLAVVEGGLPFGYPAGGAPEKTVDRDTGWSAVSAQGKVSAICAIDGYSAPLLPRGFRGRDDLNLIHQFAITPLLEVADLEGGTELHLVSYVFAGAAPMPPRPDVAVTWGESGITHIHIHNVDIQLTETAPS